jgi:hypothetical protein
MKSTSKGGEKEEKKTGSTQREVGRVVEGSLQGEEQGEGQNGSTVAFRDAGTIEEG